MNQRIEKILAEQFGVANKEAATTAVLSVNNTITDVEGALRPFIGDNHIRNEAAGAVVAAREEASEEALRPQPARAPAPAARPAAAQPRPGAGTEPQRQPPRQETEPKSGFNWGVLAAIVAALVLIVGLGYLMTHDFGGSAPSSVTRPQPPRPVLTCSACLASAEPSDALKSSLAKGLLTADEVEAETLAACQQAGCK